MAGFIVQRVRQALLAVFVIDVLIPPGATQDSRATAMPALSVARSA